MQPRQVCTGVHAHAKMAVETNDTVKPINSMKLQKDICYTGLFVIFVLNLCNAELARVQNFWFGMQVTLY